ncbi:MAG: TM2 domain-containing protein [Chloroflexi bacterium]|nr:TM2 domain-containing protein [Chloroflexota bacterium]MBM4450418.1 TM2 domain-containing protein [Chloroflexota bacterium]
MSKEAAKSRRTTVGRKSVRTKATRTKAVAAKKPGVAKKIKQTAVEQKATEPVKAPKQRSWRVAFFLSLFLGPFGADRFYIGRTRSAIVKLVTLSCFGVWWLTDFILIASDWRKDAWGRPLRH